MKRTTLALAILILFSLNSTGLATVVFDENVSGDASTAAAAPTSISVGLGENTIIGSVINSNNATVGDRDFFTFTIQPGQLLTGIFQNSFSPTNRGFHAINAGSTGIAPSGPGAGDTSQFLGSAHLDPFPADLNLLPDLGTPLAGIGFTGPLGAGDYTYVVQQTSNLVSSYSLSFVVEAVPEPSSLVLSGILFGIAGLRRTR